MPAEDFVTGRLTRKDVEWNKFVNKLVEKHLDKFDDIEESSKFNTWLVKHLIRLDVERFEEAEAFLSECMENRSAKEFAEFLKGFGERGDSLKKFEAALQKTRTQTQTTS